MVRLKHWNTSNTTWTPATHVWSVNQQQKQHHEAFYKCDSQARKLICPHFNTISRWLMYILKFSKYWCRSVVLSLGCTLNHPRSFNNHCCLGPTRRDWFIGLEYSLITGTLQTSQVLLTCNQGYHPLAGIPTPGKGLPSLPTTLLLALWIRPYQMPYSTLQGCFSTLPLTKEPF